MSKHLQIYKNLNNITKICNKIDINFDFKHINYKWEDYLNLKTNIPDFIYKHTDNLLLNDFYKIQHQLNWIIPSTLSTTFKNDMKFLGGDINGMKNALLVGHKNKGSLIHDEFIEIGYAFFKPNWFYPLHCHKTEELYYILDGHAEFGKIKNNKFKYKHVKQNDIIYHYTYQPHAMKFNDSYLLSIYIWYSKGRYYFIKEI